jgi:hypothetical protein
MKVLKKIAKMNDEQLYQLFQNAIRSESCDADTVIKAVELEWESRRQRARSGKYKAARPEKGMLSALGYHVGHSHGVPAAIRHRILRHLLEGELPLVQSPAYTDEWGEPKSPTRYGKLIRTLESLANDPRLDAQLNMEKAIIEWREDIDWVKQNLQVGWRLR